MGCPVSLLIANLFASVSMRRVNGSTRICAARGASLISVWTRKVSVLQSVPAMRLRKNSRRSACFYLMCVQTRDACAA